MRSDWVLFKDGPAMSFLSLLGVPVWGALLIPAARGFSGQKQRQGLQWKAQKFDPSEAACHRELSAIRVGAAANRSHTPAPLV